MSVGNHSGLFIEQLLRPYGRSVRPCRLGVYYQDENSVKSAVATIYSTGATSYAEYFWYMQEFPADQVTRRVWNGGQWGYDEGEKFIFSIQNWTPDAKIIRSARRMHGPLSACVTPYWLIWES